MHVVSAVKFAADDHLIHLQRNFQKKNHSQGQRQSTKRGITVSHGLHHFGALLLSFCLKKISCSLCHTHQLCK